MSRNLSERSEPGFQDMSRRMLKGMIAPHPAVEQNRQDLAGAHKKPEQRPGGKSEGNENDQKQKKKGKDEKPQPGGDEKGQENQDQERQLKRLLFAKKTWGGTSHPLV
jgi:hypothetical protein